MADSSPEPTSKMPTYSSGFPEPHLTHLQPPKQEADEGINFNPSSDSNSDKPRSEPDLKRAATNMETFRPLKRRKGPLNGDYLDLLNFEINDAAYRAGSHHQDTVELGRSQLGLTSWSEIEKQIFFDTLARVGKDGAPAISASIGTKSELEVKAYLQTLEDATSKRISVGARQAVTKAEYPAALELSQQCCHALDEAADTISLKQELREKRREESKWGEGWDLTSDMARRLERGDEDLIEEKMPSLDFFRLKNWLKLSHNVFMNSSIPGNNWNHIDNKPPSIWATTLEDFYSLTVSVTKRLVQTTLFAADTRLRAQEPSRADLGNHIRPDDVASALASLNMPEDAHKFWRKSARRLRIDVYDENDEDEDAGPMDFTDVEAALADDDEDAQEKGLQGEQGHLEQGPLRELKFADAYESEEESTTSDDSSSNDENNEARQRKAAERVERMAVKYEAKEVFMFSAATYSETRRLKQALEGRIAIERQQEQHAEEIDQRASLMEETEMWKLLKKPPPFEVPRPVETGRSQKSIMDVESIYPLGRDWRSNTQYREEWEQAKDEDQE